MKIKTKMNKETVKKRAKKDKRLVAPLFNQKGEKIGQLTLSNEIFGNKLNEKLMTQAIRVYLINQRKGSASTKTRSEVSGGGAKPWRQKGLGRARVGSIRAPQRRGGGVAHGPKPKVYRLTLPKKMRKKALLSALSSKAAAGDIIIIEQLKFRQPKTKIAAKLISALPVKRRSLLVLEGKDEATQKSIRNLPEVKVELLPNLNTFNLLNTDSLIFTKTALEKMEQLYLEKN